MPEDHNTSARQSTHAFVRLYDAIGMIDGLSAAEVSVLRCFARRCTWATGENSFPRIAEIARDTRYSERWVQKAIRSLIARDLLIERQPPTRRAPAVYAVLVNRIAQLTLAEVGTYGAKYVHPSIGVRGELATGGGVNKNGSRGELAPIYTSLGSDSEIRSPDKTRAGARDAYAGAQEVGYRIRREAR